MQSQGSENLVRVLCTFYDRNVLMILPQVHLRNGEALELALVCYLDV